VTKNGSNLSFAVILIDKARLDDPVGAVSVHLVNGIWGTLAAGIFGDGTTVKAQLIGIVVYGVFTFSAALIIFMGIKATMGLRVHRKEELAGLDISEHASESYAGFQILNN